MSCLGVADAQAEVQDLPAASIRVCGAVLEP